MDAPTGPTARADKSLAEEVVQETWLAVLQGLDRFRGEASLRTWVYRILVNQAKGRGVRERRTVPFASLAPEDDGPTVDPARFQGPDEPHPGGWRQFPEEWPEHVALTREVRDVVTGALGELPDRQRVVVALRDLDGHTADEVCDLLGISAGNQRVLLHRGRAVVRAHLERYLAPGRSSRARWRDDLRRARGARHRLPGRRPVPTGARGSTSTWLCVRGATATSHSSARPSTCSESCLRTRCVRPRASRLLDAFARWSDNPGPRQT